MTTSSFSASQDKLTRTIQRQRAYQLLSNIFAEGITATTLDLVSDIPSLSPHLPEPFEPDQSSSEYQDLFGFNVLPYAGVYLSEDGKLGGEIQQRLNAWYFSQGFDPLNISTPPDHISTQLTFLSFLSTSELGEARSSRHEKLARSARRTQAEFLQSQFFAWTLPFFTAVNNQGHPFFSEVIELTKALTIDHLLEAENTDVIPPPLPTPPDILHDRKSGLKQIAEYLVRPAYSGVYFSKQDIKSIAGRLNIPSGFGDRAQLLTNAFRSAATFDLLPAFVEALIIHVRTFKKAYQALDDIERQALSSNLNGWETRVTKTLEMLEEIGIADFSFD